MPDERRRTGFASPPRGAGHRWAPIVPLAMLLLGAPASTHAMPDIAGIRIGSTPAEVEASLRRHNVALNPHRRNQTLPVPGASRPFVAEIVAKTPSKRRPGDAEGFFVLFAAPPQEQRAVAVARLQTFFKPATAPRVEHARQTLLEKYGTPATDTGRVLVWSEARAIRLRGTSHDRAVSLCTTVEYPFLFALDRYPFPSELLEVKRGRTSLAKCGLVVAARIRPHDEDPAALGGLTLLLVDYATLEQKAARSRAFVERAQGTPPR